MFNDRKLAAPAATDSKAASKPIRIAINDTDIAGWGFKYYPVSERYLAASIPVNQNKLRFYFFDLIEERIQYQFDEPWGIGQSFDGTKEYLLFAQALFDEQFIIISSKDTSIVVNIKEQKQTQDVMPNLPSFKHMFMSLTQASYAKDTELLLSLEKRPGNVALNINPYAINTSTLISLPETERPYRYNIKHLQNSVKTVITTSRYNEHAPDQKRIHTLEEYSVDTETKTATLNKTRAMPIGISGGILGAIAFGPYVAIQIAKDKTHLHCLNTDTNQCIATTIDDSNVQWLNNGLLLFRDVNKNNTLLDPSTNEVKLIDESNLLTNGFKAAVVKEKASWLLEATPVVDCSSSLPAEAKAHIQAALDSSLLRDLQNTTASYLRRYDFFSSTAPLPPGFHKTFLAPYRLPKELQVKMLELYDTLDAKDVVHKQKKDALEEITTLINEGQDPATACDTACRKYPLADKRPFTSFSGINRTEGDRIYDLLQEIRQVRTDAAPVPQPDVKKLQ